MPNTEFKFDAIAQALSWPTDHAPKEDGLFLQPEEITTLNTRLAENPTAVSDLATANATIQSLNDKVAELNTSMQTATASITSLNEQITTLQAENKKLGGQASGTKTVVVPVDSVTTAQDEKKPKGLMDPNHPDNVEAREAVKRANKKKI